MRFNLLTIAIVWLLTGIYLLVRPGELIHKHNLSYPENLYVGSAFIIISSIIIVWKIIKWFQEPED